MKEFFLAVALVLFATAPASACKVPANANELARALFQQINEKREARGLSPLHRSALLARAAQTQACDNAAQNRLSHIGTDGSFPGDRILKAGYDFDVVTENVAIGYTVPRHVLNAWLRSASHRRNILDTRTKELAVAVALGRDGRLHWVMNGGLR